MTQTSPQTAAEPRPPAKTTGSIGDGSTVNSVSKTRNPISRASPDHRQVILFGGITTRGRLDDTWAYDCSRGTWTRLETENKPEGRCDSAMVYDTVNEQFILYGGLGVRSGLQDDTWIYDLDAHTWTEVETESNPGRMYGHTMVWDPVNERVILYGGHLNSTTSNLYVENTWFYYPQNGSWIMQKIKKHSSR
jgi:hypothetical protein